MIRTILVDDEQLVRSGLRMILDSAEDIEVVGEAGDGAEAVELAARVEPDVALLDIRMPGTDGLTAAAALADLAHPPKVVLLTTFDLDEYVHRALRAGAVGFLLKDTPPRDLISAVRTIAEGNAMLAPSITKRMLERFAAAGSGAGAAAAQRLSVLSERERDVLVAVAKGMSNAEAGRSLGMREATVKAHVSSILAKLGLSNRVQAAILAHDAGWA
ncbi:response regulator [Streptomonospora nanhaiensis]|uniref:DNA-binding NarL/FixJ family response regulator n=1 Tax=Streptomonospora nanhaiensis TaxID=1323731 RepID=A0A853BGU9_9ACTN|nr:response regulator transcription factor [Streptomonospora nanhaiensis]MBV2363745.1 response regulator transcription factor [Streptomonospora nanhaiensis]MBX9387817.1 response regulator transcription factor [Streptomonospora nanhaiensis]NYI93954.1 DNA-binding NarL/FixJ family response regulator [Streptomonospora nanhaiensis]